MKNLNILLFISFVIGGCFKYSDGKVETRLNKDVSKISSFPEELSLTNRVNNCDSAIAYMAHIIKPQNIFIHRYEVREITVNINIPGESLNFLHARDIRDGDRRSLHFAPKCFYGMKLEDVLEVLCTRKDAIDILKYNKFRNDVTPNGFWVLYVNIKGVDVFFLHIKSGIVSHSDFMEIPIPEE